MKVVITEIFCEILTGLFASFVGLAILDFLRVVTFEQVWEIAKPPVGFPFITGLLIAAYLLGVVLDAVGLVFDNIFDNLICADPPSSEQIGSFWKNSEAHVLAYRDNVWAYYFCYRNLFILTLPAIVFGAGTLYRRGLPGWAFFLAITLVAMGIVFFLSMRTLLKLYYDITKSFEEIVCERNGSLTT